MGKSWGEHHEERNGIGSSCRGSSRIAGRGYVPDCSMCEILGPTCMLSTTDPDLKTRRVCSLV